MACGAAAVGSIAVKSAQVPTPTVLRMLMSPPIAWAMSRAIVRPSPVPSKGRAAAPPTWRKASKTCTSSEASMPGPVSCTSALSRPLSASRISVSVIEPCCVNLTALPSRLCSTCRTRAGSPVTQQGWSNCSVSLKSSPLSMARTVYRSARFCTTAPSSKLSLRIANWPASMREMSSRSLISPNRCVPEDSISSRRRLTALSPASRCSSRVTPRMPCSGVRSSWLTLLMNCVFTALWRNASFSASSFSTDRACARKRSMSTSTSRFSEAMAVVSSRPSSISSPVPPIEPSSSPRGNRPNEVNVRIGAT